MNQRKVKSVLGRDLEELSNCFRQELVSLWSQSYGQEPPKGISRRLLEYSAAYQIQAKALGGLSPPLRRRLRRQLRLDRTSKSTTAPRMATRPPTGTRLLREWHGEIYTVDVVNTGYRYDGKVYSSLSRVAQVITGARWSGPRFFGL